MLYNDYPSISDCSKLIKYGFSAIFPFVLRIKLAKYYHFNCPELMRTISETSRTILNATTFES